ncbi:MAG: DUF5615 family PIN-like protein [Leptolyngbyaceae cyanobacterium]
MRWANAATHPTALFTFSHLLIWEYAKVNNFAIVSKDSDFNQRSLL